MQFLMLPCGSGEVSEETFVGALGDDDSVAAGVVQGQGGDVAREPAHWGESGAAGGSAGEAGEQAGAGGEVGFGEVARRDVVLFDCAELVAKPVVQGLARQGERGEGDLAEGEPVVLMGEGEGEIAGV